MPAAKKPQKSVKSAPKPAGSKAVKRSMTDSHRAAIASGRLESKAVNDYLEALRSHRPRRGRQRTPDSIRQRLAVIEEKLPGAGVLAALKLIQERVDLTRELEAMSNARGPAEFVDAFVEHAGAFGRRHGITAAAWREIGVPAQVLKRAGIS